MIKYIKVSTNNYLEHINILKNDIIRSKSDLQFFLEADRIALGRTNKSTFFKGLITPDYVFRFQKLLRKCEYYHNNQIRIFNRILYLLFIIYFYKLSIKLGFSIPLNTFGPGLSIAHIGTIIVNKNAKIGSNCRIHAGTNIGSEAGFANKAPQLGDNLYIGPGAVIYGSIKIADNCAIGANAVVNKDFLNQSKVIAGVPAREIADIDIKRINIIATKIIELKIDISSISGLPAEKLNNKLKNLGY